MKKSVLHIKSFRILCSSTVDVRTQDSLTKHFSKLTAQTGTADNALNSRKAKAGHQN